MGRQDPERLKRYLELVTRKRGGLEAAVQDLQDVAQARDESAMGGLEAAVGGERQVEVAQRAIEDLARGRLIGPDQQAGLEAIIDANLRPAFDVQDGRFTADHPLWRHLSNDAVIQARVEAVLPSIGRIELPGHPRLPYGGTGFVVGDDLLMTNRHVAAIFSEGLGDRNLRFMIGLAAGIDFLRERDRPTGPVLTVRRVVLVHPYWDMAILAVEGLPATRSPLRLGLTDARDLTGHEIFVVGYPAFDPRNPEGEQNDLFRGRFGIKRLQPGLLQGGMNTASFSKIVPAASHDCSTLGGNSGSAVIDLATGEVLGLHFGGLYHERNYAVPSAALARDARVVDTGVSFAGTPPGGTDPVAAPWWARADAGEAPVVAAEPSIQSPAVATASPPPAAQPGTGLTVTDGEVTFEIPLRITISLGRRAAATEAVAGAAVPPADEALREPFHDTDYATRRGYDPGFLDPATPALQVPMPEATDPEVVALTRDGKPLLAYQNFSIMMHKRRRLALVCASNVTAEPALKRPEPGRDYGRRGLSGLGPSDQERWYLDPRLDSAAQLPDVFFSKDRKAFDKGHIVRRDDVAWGQTYDEVRRGNGDSYHVTNCSPQVKGFNQSQEGQDNWGDLENHVLANAASERLCVLAGPVLDPADQMFVGIGECNAVLRAKVPVRFWKVIVARIEDGLAAYGFVLEQDLSAVEWEMMVPASFVPAMRPLAEIAAMAGIIFAPALLAADQHDTVRGGEMALRSGTRLPRG